MPDQVPASTGMSPLDELACLAHTVPGVTLRLALTGGEHALVSYACLGADLDPCQLRAALMCDRARSSAPLAGVVERVEIVAGLCPIGGGLYARTSPDGATERWLVSSLPADSIVSVVETGATELDPDVCAELRITVKPDADLGVCAVCITTGTTSRSVGGDDIAVWALARIAVAELLAAVDVTDDSAAAGSIHPPHPTKETP